jgi:CheY-like chemotaxis protein
MPKNLLLADDSITIQKVVGITFANEDYKVTTVDNGEDAISKARELRPDVILADVVMPRKNGYEVCEAVKADPGLRHIPVLLLAGTFEAFDEARARQARADGHIAKPFESQALITKVKELTARGAAGAAAPAAGASARPAAPPPTAARPAAPGAPRPGAPVPPAGARPPGPGMGMPPPAGAPRPGAPMPFGARPPGQGAPPAGARPAGPIPPGMAPRPQGPGMPGAMARPGGPMPQPAARPPGPGMGMPPPGAPRPGAPMPFGARPPGPVAPPAGARAAPGPGFAPRPAPSPQAVPTQPSSAAMPAAARRDPFGFGVGAPDRKAPAPAAPPPAREEDFGDLEVEPRAPASFGDSPAEPELAPVHAFVPPPESVGHRPEPSAPAAADGGEAVLRDALSRASREVIEKVVWEVVPQLAETIIRENLDRLVKQRQG